MQTRLFNLFGSLCATRKPSSDDESERIIKMWLLHIYKAIELYEHGWSNDAYQYLAYHLNNTFYNPVTGQHMWIQFTNRYISALLQDAMNLGDLTLINILLPYCPPETPPLHLAADTNINMFETILSTYPAHEVDKVLVCTVDDLGDNLLHKAVRLGNLVMLERILNEFLTKDLPLNVRNSSNDTALHLCFCSELNCTRKERQGMANLLISHGADCMVLNNMGKTVHLLAKKFRITLTTPGQVNISSQTVPTTTPTTTPDNTRILAVEFCSPEPYQASASTSSSSSCFSFFPSEVIDAFIESIKLDASVATYTYLNQTPSLVNLKDQIGWTPLHHAAKGGSPALIDLLLQYNAPLNAVANDGNTPLHIAAKYGRPETLKKLLEYKPQLIRNGYGQGVFPIALSQNEAIRQILEDYENNLNLSSTSRVEKQRK